MVNSCERSPYAFVEYQPKVVLGGPLHNITWLYNSTETFNVFPQKTEKLIYRLIPFKVPVETEANQVIGDRKNGLS